MIKSSELRVGNLFHPMHGGKIHLPGSEVFEIQELLAFKSRSVLLGKIPAQEIEWKEIEYKMMCAISITEQWLIKLGFKDYSHDNNGLAFRLRFDSKTEFAYYISDKCIRYQSTLSGFAICFDHIKHVHQLQNLYFTFRNEELKIC